LPIPMTSPNQLASGKKAKTRSYKRNVTVQKVTKLVDFWMARNLSS